MIFSNLLNLRRFFYSDYWYNDDSVVGSGVINDGDEHFVVFKREGNLGYLYIDNVLQSVAEMNSTQLEIDSDIRIGRSHFDSFDFNGTVRDFRVHNYALGGGEIGALYELG